MEADLVKWITTITGEKKLYKFYKSKEWLALRANILRDHHYECMWCKEKGIITRASVVHHVQYVPLYPTLALSEYYTYDGKQYRNLIPLCHECHDKAHERMQYKPKPKLLNKEKW